MADGTAWSADGCLTDGSPADGTSDQAVPDLLMMNEPAPTGFLVAVAGLPPGMAETETFTADRSPVCGRLRIGCAAISSSLSCSTRN